MKSIATEIKLLERKLASGFEKGTPIYKPKNW